VSLGLKMIGKRKQQSS